MDVTRSTKIVVLPAKSSGVVAEAASTKAVAAIAGVESLTAMPLAPCDAAVLLFERIGLGVPAEDSTRAWGYPSP